MARDKRREALLAWEAQLEDVFTFVDLRGLAVPSPGVESADEEVLV